MLSEVILIQLLILISLQSSSLWSSLMIVPVSVTLVFLFMSMNMFSGINMIIYVLVFVGGLMVLLLSVASISKQEQNRVLNIFLISSALLLSIPLFYEKKIPTMSTSRIITFMWLDSQELPLFLISLLLLISLTVLSKFFMSFKGFIRSL